MIQGLSSGGALVALLFCSCSSSPGPAPSDARADAQPADTQSLADTRPLADTRSPSADVGQCKLVKPYSSKNAVCNGCAESKCCVEMNGCLGSPDCDDSYVNCTLVCALSRPPDAGIDSCLAACAKDYPKGKAEYDAAIGCADTKCAVECK